MLNLLTIEIKKNTNANGSMTSAFKVLDKVGDKKARYRRGYLQLSFPRKTQRQRLGTTGVVCVIRLNMATHIVTDLS